MQYLYVLTSNPNDTYYEQFLLSVTSLKLVMPLAEVTLLCDKKTKSNLAGKRHEYEKLVSNIITEDVHSSMSYVEVSRWLKTSMRRLVKGDFLFIDSDTIVTDCLHSIAEQKIIFGACLDKHSLISDHSKKNNIFENDKHLGFNSYLSNKHYNSGVIFCVDNPETHKIFDRWHKLWLFSKSKNIVRDQPSFNMAIHENLSLFTELNGTWNCQIAFNGLPYLINSRIIHYFATNLALQTSPFLFASVEIFRKIKETGIIPDETLELLNNPMSAFDRRSQIIAENNTLIVINSSFFEAILLIYKKIPVFFNFINGLCYFIKKIVKKFLVKIDKKKSGGINLYN
jgi:hypothetical protein